MVEPGTETAEGFGAFVEGDGPFVDELAVETVHEEGLSGGLDGGCG